VLAVALDAEVLAAEDRLLLSQQCLQGRADHLRGRRAARNLDINRNDVSDALRAPPQPGRLADRHRPDNLEAGSLRVTARDHFRGV
jgi:hypothetical protein